MLSPQPCPNQEHPISVLYMGRFSALLEQRFLELSQQLKSQGWSKSLRMAGRLRHSWGWGVCLWSQTLAAPPGPA